jgi:dipeptidyl-peptidase-3
MIANRNRPPNLDLIDPAKQVPLVDPREAATYMLHEHYAWDIHIAIHELLGHGTGNRHLKEEDDGSYNFDKSNPPANPLTGQPIQTFYKKNQTVTSVFDDLGQTLNECRADCVALYLITNKKILSIFGYNDASDITADERN